MMKKNAFLFLFGLLLITACSSVKYSFTGADISPDIETVSVTYFNARAPLAPPTLSQVFTEDLRDIFLNQTSLELVDKYGDLQMEGEITGYQTRPVAIQGNETAALSRLTITVNVRYTNTKEESKSFESSFTRFADFDSAQNLNDVEDGLIEEINDQLVQDIFNRAVTNW